MDQEKLYSIDSIIIDKANVFRFFNEKYPNYFYLKSKKFYEEGASKLVV